MQKPSHGPQVAHSLARLQPAPRNSQPPLLAWLWDRGACGVESYLGCWFFWRYLLGEDEADLSGCQLILSGGAEWAPNAILKQQSPAHPGMPGCSLMLAALWD